MRCSQCRVNILIGSFNKSKAIAFWHQLRTLNVKVIWHNLLISTAGKIRAFVSERCMTSDGAYAVYAGSEAVDITAALYPVWWYDKPDSNAMKQTIKRIEEEHKEGELYHRHLIMSDAKKEGVFLAGCLWVAQYYVMLKDLKKAKTIIDAVLQFTTDLGFLPEEGDVKTGELLGNIPQTFVHSSLMGVILDYNAALNATANE